ncbi:MAG: nickel pincer cofactor biosynthesis protein LarC [Desulfobacteraceae bacterium]
MTTAYFDCFSGISGDMTLGALVGLGVPVEWIQKELEQLPLDEFSLNCGGVNRNGIHSNLMEIRFEESHHHRNYQTIAAMIEESSFTPWVKRTSLEMFDRVAAAEAAVHRMPKEKVHFHEVGAMDAIIDIVGTCLGLAYLNIDRVTASPLPLGSGFVECQHGTLPVPAPATLEILKGVPVRSGTIAKEMVTPTGAAIISTIADRFEPMPLMRVERIAYGAGTRDLGTQPNLLRVILGASEPEDDGRHLERQVMVECNIDDMNPEWFGYLMETLFDEKTGPAPW